MRVNLVILLILLIGLIEIEPKKIKDAVYYAAKIQKRQILYDSLNKSENNTYNVMGVSAGRRRHYFDDFLASLKDVPIRQKRQILYDSLNKSENNTYNTNYLKHTLEYDLCKRECRPKFMKHTPAYELCKQDCKRNFYESSLADAQQRKQPKTEI
uniref:Uncharacterized protein n=1 Tax=Acrobeloides nanus TaxID=290746 RepID=A0A914CEV6_9BILA